LDLIDRDRNSFFFQLREEKNVPMLSWPNGNELKHKGKARNRIPSRRGERLEEIYHGAKQGALGVYMTL
jgi:hypothetical protein